MKTNDILLDLEFSLPRATREPAKGNVIDPTHVVIKGLKYTLVVDLEIDQDEWNNYYSSIKDFYVFDADNLPVENIAIELLRDWIVKTFLYKEVGDFKESKYEDFNEWIKNSPLVELGINFLLK